MPVVVVGAGAGPGQMTGEGKLAMDAADLVFASGRYAWAREDARPFSLSEIERADRAGRSVCALVTGDAGLFSALRLIQSRVSAVRVVPGVSSVQTLAARLREGWEGAKILSAHGRALAVSALGHAVRTHERTYVLLDGERGPGWLAGALLCEGLGDAAVAIGENLSEKGERVTEGAPREILEMTFAPLSLARVYNPNPASGLPPVGIEDAAFVRGGTPMTKRTIRMLAVSELGLRPDSVVWDVGAGTGSISIECARQCPLGRVHAVERDGEALSLIGENKARFHANNLIVHAGEAPQALDGLEPPTHVFLGGTGGQLEQILPRIAAFPGVRLVATAVTLETAGKLKKGLSAWRNVRAFQAAISQIEGEAGMLRANNPIFIFTADNEV